MFMLRQFARHSLVLILCGLVATGSIAATPSATILSGQCVLVLGDSITQDGRYVSFLQYYLSSAGQKCDLISIGLGSETVSGLSEPDHPYPRPCVFERLDRALKAVKPSVVLACYGMNDGIYHPAAPERLAAFNTGLHQLIEKVRATGAQLVLITPPVFDPLPLAAKTVPATAEKFGYGSPYAGYDNVLAGFAAAEVALNEPGVTVIDLHTPMAEALASHRKQDPAFSFARDGVHPSDTGHLFMAHIIATGLGLILSPTETDATLAQLRTDALFSLVREQRELRSEAWLPFVGYTRGQTFKSASVDATERTVLRLAQQIDALAPKPVHQD
jgi:lysophospholipase L1-like esterase